jgi:hypothetical protein
VYEQSAENRWVVHLLHYIPEHRIVDIDIIEHVIPVYDIKVSVKTAKEVKAVICVPEQQSLPLTSADGYTEFVLPKAERASNDLNPILKVNEQRAKTSVG